MSAVEAFLDANVLYPALLRDILLRLASWELFQPRWSARVQEEWTSALVLNNPDFRSAKIERTRHLMEKNFPDANVVGFERLVETLTLPDPDDRHVLAAAIHCKARYIVTVNLRDFPASILAGFNIEALHPDTFLLALLKNDRDRVLAVLRLLRASLKNPPYTAAELLAAMRRQGLEGTVEALETNGDRL